MLKITQVTRYRARYWPQTPGPARIAEYATLETLHRRIAWWMVVDRYAHYADGDLPSVKVVHNHECTCAMCDDTPFGGEFWDHRDCPIHDRDNGYFRRLQQRIARWIQAGYIQVDGSRQP